MGGIVSTEIQEAAFSCAQVLADNNGGDTLVIDLRKVSGWTDFFVIATATSSTHMRGLVRHLDDYVHTQGITALRRPRAAEDEQWCLVDFGNFVVHIMSTEARAFYELESLWSEGKSTEVAPKTNPV